MHTLRAVLALGFWMCGYANGGPVVLPTDVSVALTADPNADLQSGQRIAFAISVTNHGPEPADQLAIRSSPIYDELDVFTASSSDCDGDIVLSVVDLEDTFYYSYAYYAAFLDWPLPSGETRTCHLSLDFTPWAPSVFPVTFGFSSYLTDLDPSNNSVTVFLRRPEAVVEQVPTLSPLWLGLLVCFLVATAGYAERNRTHSLGHSLDIET